VPSDQGERIAVEARDGLPLAGEVHGPADGTPVIFLHGGGQSRSAWRVAARRLGEATYRAATMDLRGHGDSGWSDELAYTFDDYAADLVATIDALGGGPAILVGASLGGHISVVTAARFPERVRAVLLADVTPWIDEAIGGAIRQTIRGAGSGFASLEEASAMISALRGTPPHEGGLDSLQRFMRQRDDGRWYFRWDIRLMDDAKLHGGGEGGLFRREAVKLTVPILVMRAEHSTMTGADQVAAFRAAVPQVQDVLIKGVGHMVSGDVNDVYADAILTFLARRPEAESR